MTNIVVAYRDGVLTAPNGEKFRTVRGKTLADARHPAVQMRPESWGPVVIELSVDDTDGEIGADVDARVSELTTQLEETRAELDRFGSYLTAIAEALAVRGLVPAETDRQGWLVDAVIAGLDASAPPVVVPEEGGSVRPPRGARPRKTAKPAAVAPASEVEPDYDDEEDDLA